MAGEEDGPMGTALVGMVRRPEMCQQLGIVPRTAREWAVRGYGPPPRKVGGRVYYLQSEIDAFVQDVKNAPSVVA